ncbi:MAG: hypothetical protein GY862_36605 [Gammaproteobacteria bacterium]|nr:hypothetical protein [Gammaproteobacteria bacterium]
MSAPAGDGSFNAQIAAAEGDVLNIRAVGGAGRRSGAISVSAAVLLEIAVTSPSDGAVIAANQVRVEGTYSGPMNTGIAVNGVVALTDGGRFIADNVPLSAGENTLVAKAVSLADGIGSPAVGIQVQSLGEAPVLRLSVSDSGMGIAPLAVSFEYDFTAAGAAQHLSLDFEGDGAADFTAGGGADFPEHIYNAPGWYFPSLAVTDASGALHAAEAAVLVQDGAAMDTLFNALWNGMNNALTASDASAALNYLNVAAQYKYAPIFEVLLPHMPEIIASYSPLLRASISGKIGEYAINRTIDGQLRIFFIYFLKGADGVWHLDSM